MLYLTYAGYEVRKWWRDAMTRFMLIYPVMMGLIGRFLIPLAERQAGASFAPYYHVILVGLGLVVARISGSVVAFSILDDRDDNVLYSVKVAPLSLEVFIGIKLVMVFILGFFGSAFVLWFADLMPLSPGTIFAIAFLAAFNGPITALLLNVLAKNKVEGFAVMKSLGAFVFFPIASLFFHDAKEFIFAVEPGFWPAKAFTAQVTGGAFQLSALGYYLIGLAYAVVLTFVVYRLFERRVE